MTAPRSIPPDPRGPPGPEEAGRGSRVMRFGAAASAVLLSSLIATMPAAVRLAPSLSPSCDATTVWVALLAIAILPLAIATVTLRHAIAALRLFDAKAVSRGVATALVWASTTFVAFAGLAAFLRATTHHHGLAGLTFACVGLVLAAVLALFVRRAVDWTRAAAPPVRWSILASVGLLLGVALAFFTRVVLHGEGASALAVDIFAFAFATAFGAGAFPYRSHPFAPLALAGPPLAAIVLVVGLGAFRSAPILRAALADQAPAFGAAAALLPDALFPPAAAPRAAH